MICPKCKLLLEKNNNCFKCQNNHSYDISKEGYVNLLLNKTNSGDNKDLVNARIKFLNKHYYDFLANSLNDIINNIGSNLKVLDCGCGVGYYDLFIKNQDLTLLDISKYAISNAAKINKNSLCCVAGNNDLPFSDKSFDVLLFIFSPIFISEAKRVLNEKGVIINITPGKNHLYEMKELLYKNPYYNKDTIISFDGFRKETINVTKKVHINNEDLHYLIGMTPYKYKTNKFDIDNLNITDLDITFDFLITKYTLNIV